MKALIALVLLAPALMAAQTPVKWEPMKAEESNAKFSEGWRYGDCVVWVLKDSTALDVFVRQENYHDPKHIPRDGPDGNPLPRTLTEEITIAPGTNGKPDTRTMWYSASEMTFYFDDDGPDLFALHYREAAQSLPPNVREKFHHLYGIEP